MITYQDAGVNIDAGNQVVHRIKNHVQKTFSSQVIGGFGGFGGCYDLSEIARNYVSPIMIQSIDGVGTKTIIARMAGKYDTLGQDLLSACSNDILVLGAKTITMLDYIANDKLDPIFVEEFVKGLSQACCEHGVSLLGGETAEMPDIYLPGEHDLVGVVTGVVEKNQIIDGTNIKVGDFVFGLASNGLNTNGFSLARKLIFDVGKYKINQIVPELNETVAEALLIPHVNYAKPVHALLRAGIIPHGMAHITGGGLLENIPRILPQDCCVEIQCDSWPVPPIFELLKSLGQLPQEEAFRTLNMGIGWVLIVSGSQVSALKGQIPDAYQIGQVVSGKREVRLV